MKNIFVVTHAQSIHHIENKVGGWFDTGLTTLGKRQAELTADKLKQLINVHTPSILSSDLKRSKETASTIAKEFGCSFSLTKDLRELSYGVAEGKPENWLSERITPAPENDRLDHICIEGAESKRELIARVYRAVDVVIAADSSNHILVTHGFAFTFVIARWIGIPIESAGHVNFKSSTGGISHLQQDDFWCNRGVRYLNDTSHLAV